MEWWRMRHQLRGFAMAVNARHGADAVHSTTGSRGAPSASKLTYSMSTMWLTQKQGNTLDAFHAFLGSRIARRKQAPQVSMWRLVLLCLLKAFHVKCLCSMAGIPST